MTPEEIIIDNVENSTSWVLSYDMIYEVIIPCMEEYGKQQWNEAIKLAAEKAEAVEGWNTSYSGNAASIDKNSILKLLK